jgi:hypothetical protein
MSAILRSLVTGVALASLVVGSALPAGAAEVVLEDTLYIEINGGDDESGGVTVEVDDYGLDQIEVHCAEDSHDDAFALRFLQEGDSEPNQFQAPDGLGDETSVAAGTRVTTESVTAESGMEVSFDLLAFSALSEDYTAVVRVIWVLENPTSADITETYAAETDFGSDGDTTVEETSSGGDFEDTTGWAVTSDDGDSDNVNLTAYQGPQPTAASPSLVEEPTDTEYWDVDFEVTVPAGETRYLAFFAVAFDYGDCGSGTPSFAEAKAAAKAYAANFQSAEAVFDAGLFAGVPDEDLALIANWAPFDPTPPEPPTPPTPPTPEPTPPATEPEMVTPAFTG